MRVTREESHDKARQVNRSEPAIVHHSGTTATTLIGPASRKTAGAQFSDIAVRFVGTNKPTLIFVHGFVCSLDDWDQQVAALSPRFRCVALDLPGQGHSARPATASIAVMGSAVNQVKERFERKECNPHRTQHGLPGD